MIYIYIYKYDIYVYTRRKWQQRASGAFLPISRWFQQGRPNTASDGLAGVAHTGSSSVDAKRVAFGSIGRCWFEDVEKHFWHTDILDDLVSQREMHLSENVLYNGFGLWDALVWLQQRNENKASSRSSKILQQCQKQQEPRDHTPMQRSKHFTMWACPNICRSDSKKHTGVPTFAYWGFEHVWTLLRQIWSWKAVMT